MERLLRTSRNRSNKEHAMESPHSHGIGSRLAIQVVCANVVLSMSPLADARATTNSTSFAPPTNEEALKLMQMHPSPSLASALRAFKGGASIGGEDVETIGTLSLLANSAQSLDAAPKVVLSSGAIEADVDVFRALLGGPNNNALPGEQPSGRREINWDGVPASFTNVPTFPNDFFNTNSTRGLVYQLTGNHLEVSDQSFVDVNPAYAGKFVPFSGHKTFSPIGTIATEVDFFVAGTDTKAAVRGVGVVFLDVDKFGSSGIELLGENGVDLGIFFAPVRSDRRGASFVGVAFRNPMITHVHIRTGDGVLAANQIDISDGGPRDLVVMDDIIYGEPTALGE
jgi:hypothetical protein